MADLTIPQCAYVWENNGGAKSHVIVAVAVSSAESSRRTDAISPSNDYGLWQINASNFGWLGLTPSTALMANPNARAAIRMSSNGTNWAPWCTCWVDPAANCGHGNLPFPERGSPAYAFIDQVAAALGQHPPVPPPPGDGGGTGGHNPAPVVNALVQMVEEYKRYNNTHLRGHARWHRNVTTIVGNMVKLCPYSITQDGRLPALTQTPISLMPRVIR